MKNVLGLALLISLSAAGPAGAQKTKAKLKAVPLPADRAEGGGAQMGAEAELPDEVGKAKAEPRKQAVPEAADSGPTQAEVEAELRAKYDWARDPEPGAEKAPPKPSAAGRKTVIIASSEEHGAGLKENLGLRFDEMEKAAVEVRILNAGSSDVDAICSALRKAAKDGAKTVALDGDFAKTDEVSECMGELRAQGIYARAIGTAWMKYR